MTTLSLKRWKKGADGVFGNLFNDQDELIAVTLEHAYPSDSIEQAWFSKIPDGEYVCQRGPHRLNGMTSDFETFEITGIIGHTGLLFHWGNYNKDSEGCVLLGKMKVDSMITNSREAFADFMKMMDGIDEFSLNVTSS